MRKIVALSLCFLMLFGCGKVPQNPDEKPVPPTVSKPVEKPIPPVVKKPLHPLTGLETDIADNILLRKPVAIMVGNSRDAQPQLGVSQADILIEMMAEGGTTRIMALWQDPSMVRRIGSIRSARPYFIDMAQWLDAYFLHFGASVPAYEAIKVRKDLVALDGIRGGYEGTLFVRDPDRRKNYSLEHTAVTSGERIEATLAKFKDTTKKDPTQQAFSFNAAHSAASGAACSKVTLDYFTLNKPSFAFNPDQSVYIRKQYGKEHTDGEYGQAVAVHNLFVLEMPLAPVPGDPLKIIEVQTTGSGAGKYFCEGKYVDITWKKEGYNKPLQLFDPQGKVLAVSPGNSFIAVIKTGGKMTIE